MQKFQKGFTVVELTTMVVWLVGVIGWVLNIVKLVTTDLKIVEFGMMEILRIIGVFLAPLGAVLGFL